MRSRQSSCTRCSIAAAVHVERPARREDGLARKAVGRPGPRAEQSGRRDRTQRRAARGSPRGGRAGDTRAGRLAADRRTTRRHRHGAHLVPGTRARRAVADPAGGARGRDRRLARGSRRRRRRRGPARRNRRDARRARSNCRRDQRPAARRGSPLGRRRMLGSRDRLGDSGGRDADFRPGHGHQGIHAHGPGDRGRAGGPCVKPRQHGRRSQLEGAIEIGRRHRRRRTRISRAFAASSASSTRSGRT